MKTWTVGKRLVLGFSALVLLILVMGTGTWREMASIHLRIDSLSQDTLPVLSLTEEIRFQAAQLRITNFKHAMYGEDALKQDMDKQAREDEKVLEDLVQRCGKSIRQPDQRQAFSTIPPLLEAYRAETGKLRAASTAHKAEEVQALLLSAGKIGNEFLANLAALRGLANRTAAAEAQSIKSSTVKSQRLAVLFSLLAVLLGTLIALAITRSIAHILRRVAQELHAGAEQTSDAAGHVAASSSQLADGASNQAAALQEASSTLEQIATMTQRGSDHAQKVSVLGTEARGAAERGAEDMKAMSGAMQGISASSDDIAKIIRTIDEIAFQTNILALNAAVEAARAGEAGMGFAVVADEVRALAQRSAKAAKETAGKIEGAIAKTHLGVELSGKVASALDNIVTRAREVDRLAAELAVATTEQRDGINQVNSAVAQMDQLTQANAASAEECAAAAEELNAQAELMRNSVGDLRQLVGDSLATTRPQQSPVHRPSTHEIAPAGSISMGATQPPTPAGRQECQPAATLSPRAAPANTRFTPDSDF